MRFKYPRTMHLPFSLGVSSDDRVIKTLDHFEGKEVVVTVKMDGENSTLYRHAIHARSLDSKHHVSRTWIKQFHGQIAHEIPDGWRVCGENLFARHSIAYDDLKSYFYGFSVWDDQNKALSWDETLYFFEDLGITPVEELYRGEFSTKGLIDLSNNLDLSKVEGFVVRTVDEIPFDQFHNLVAKWVRQGHVQTDTHWMHAEVVPNLLK